ncbi:MerR family transcriptional regulator [Jidongwangia harbinensis]|uniref:MerR family transcriptional regulator n=1 Tax=Jidongwangia harbinensis TaxID=2878561 RepID=UPI001CD9EAE0|nr:MerR family transcriptional regulator [Jidongwangia harbinensis]MCA2214970.1 MerR family transcriptional regulator [Jidongwangia harbinensis]
MGWRGVDLARLAGVSTQQIRNYLDAGVLPAAPRSPAGYRQFGERHRGALLAFRALGAGYGWDTARAVMRAVHAGDRAGALARVDAAHAALHAQRLSLREVADALAAVAQAPPSALPRTALRIGELAAHLGVRTSAIRVWEAAGLLRPDRERGTGYRRYAPADVRDARMVAMLRQARYPLAQIGPILDGLRREGSTEALRTATARRQGQVSAQSLAMLAAAGLLHEYLTGFAPPPQR